MRCYRFFLIALLTVVCSNSLYAEDFYLNSPRNEGLLRFEIDNDAVWNTDSQFSNGWSLQYHTACEDSWDNTRAPGFIKWIGNHFPTLGDEDSVVRYGHGLGQNMITPGDISAETPLEGDMPYAGTLTYTFNWQSFNRQTARNFQISAGVLGEESLAEQFQKFVHNDMGLGDDPRGWDTQRDTEPVLNLGYQHLWRLVHLGEYTNGWAGQLVLVPSVHLGNLFTAAEFGIGLRFGWNIPEGFNTYPAPPGRGFFQAYNIPKPSSASRHSFEMVLAARATGIGYSVLYDGSFITNDDREVEREDFIYSGGLAFNYHYYGILSIRVSLLQTSDVLVEESLPVPEIKDDLTETDNSYGALAVEFHF
jgi:lipid A 3-O-deacylase